MFNFFLFAFIFASHSVNNLLNKIKLLKKIYLIYLVCNFLSNKIWDELFILLITWSIYWEIVNEIFLNITWKICIFFIKFYCWRSVDFCTIFKQASPNSWKSGSCIAFCIFSSIFSSWLLISTNNSLKCLFAKICFSSSEVSKNKFFF